MLVVTAECSCRLSSSHESVSGTVDFITGKMGHISEQRVANDMGVNINSVAAFNPAACVQKFKMANALDMVWMQSCCM
jgi:hypothetical protein